ncbi:MAG: aminotransferase class V-fold PLP-dependent enzyme [Alphaproteobacteria bacterium]
MLVPSAKEFFSFEPGVTYLNHGATGVTPREVLDTREAVRRAVEESPVPYALDTQRPAWQKVAALVAERFGVAGQEVALIGNVTEGINAILRAQAFAPGDEILTTSTGYGSITMTAEHIAKSHGAKVTLAAIDPFSPSPEQALDAVRAAITPRTKLAILDHITSGTALVMPIAAMTKLCHERGVQVLVDAAHVPGNIPFSIKETGADWYVASLHKWHFAPRGCAFLWAAPDRQAALQPSILSWDSKYPFPNNFQFTGTRDDSNFLSIPAAFGFMDRLGEDNVLRHNHALIRQGRDILAEAWGVRGKVPDEMIGSMILVPLPEDLPYKADDDGCYALQQHLARKHSIVAYVPFAAQGRLWTRVAAQIYNGPEDFEKLAKVVLDMRKPGYDRADPPYRPSAIEKILNIGPIRPPDSRPG